jgi:hypothetical protein
VLMDDLAAVERSWSSLWDDALASGGWERWLVSGRLAAYRAELDLASGRLDDAFLWCTRAIELAEQGGRRKYLANAKTTRGRVLTAQGSPTSSGHPCCAGRPGRRSAARSGPPGVPATKRIGMHGRRSTSSAPW